MCGWVEGSGVFVLPLRHILRSERLKRNEYDDDDIREHGLLTFICFLCYLSFVPSLAMYHFVDIIHSFFYPRAEGGTAPCGARRRILSSIFSSESPPSGVSVCGGLVGVLEWVQTHALVDNVRLTKGFRWWVGEWTDGWLDCHTHKPAGHTQYTHAPSILTSQLASASFRPV